MPRSRNILQSEFPYSVGARCLNKEWFKVPIQDVWIIMSNHLYFIHHAFNAQIHSFVLMSNHFHCLISTPDSNLDKIMAYFMKETSRNITEKSGRINQTYGARYFKTVLQNYHYFMNSYKYIYRNPVEAKLVNNVEDYPYSTLYGLLGKAPIYFPVLEDTILVPDINETLKWLNNKPMIEDTISMKAALKKRTFKLRNNRKNNKMNRLESNLF